MRSMIVGQNGRESALAWRMAESSTLYAFMAHANPSIIEQVTRTGGRWQIGNVLDPSSVAAFAVRHAIDMAMVSSDEPLAAGIVDALTAVGIKCVGPTKAGAEIEWNKILGRQLVAEVAPEANPIHVVVNNINEIDEAFAHFDGEPVAVKPVGLTGGKGVKVMGVHLVDTDAAKAYVREILTDGIGGGGHAIIEEKIIGAEFNIQVITDGKTAIFPPATYDYPYRYAGDTGPGTGGMGCYSVRSQALPFMEARHYEQAQQIVQKVLKKLEELGRNFNGILYPGFFITNKGELKVVEFNARFGDPESMNILMLLETKWTDIMEAIYHKRLDALDVRFRDACSVLVYLVAPEYATGKKGGRYDFTIDVKSIRQSGCQIFFSASEKDNDNVYHTVGTSRCVAIGAVDKDLATARATVGAAIAQHFQGALEWRVDIASPENIESIRKIIT